MAAKEVIYFPFSAQLTLRSFLPALLSPEPLSESPLTNPSDCADRGRRSDRLAICVFNTYINDRTAVPAASNPGDSNAKSPFARSNSLDEIARVDANREFFNFDAIVEDDLSSAYRSQREGNRKSKDRDDVYFDIKDAEERRKKKGLPPRVWSSSPDGI
jgi:hypothetical protein